MNKNSSLKTIAAITLTILLFSSMYYLHSIKTSLTNESTSYFIELLDKTTRLIKIKTEANFQILKTIAPETSKIASLTPQERLNFLKRKVENCPFTSLAYADSSGMAIVTTGELLDVTTNNFYQLSFYKQENCIESLNNNIIFSIPILDSEKKVAGVLYASVYSEDFFHDSIASFIGLNNVTSYILSNTTMNTYFLSKDVSPVFIESLKHESSRNITPLFKNSNIQLTEFFSANEKFVFANATIQSEDNNLNWSLVTIIPSSVFSSAANQTIALISLLLFLLLIVFMGTIAYILNMQTKNKSDLEKIAYIDTLCEIYNNNGLIFYGEKKLKLWQINIAVIYLDIDNFKMINNIFGYDYGDQLLKSFSLIFKKIFKTQSISARLSMDHFAIIVHYPNKLIFFKTLNRFISSIKNSFSQKHLLKISLGLYFPDDNTTESITSMLNKANIARKKVKNKDRLPYFIYNRKLEQDLYYKTWLLTELKAALKTKSLELFYQPQYKLTNLKIDSAEAILVWQHPKKGFIPQNIFLKIATDNQLRSHLTNLTLEKICIDMQICKQQNLQPRKVCLTLSKYDFYQNNLADTFVQIIRHHNLDFNLFELAIEETTLVNNYHSIEPHLTKFRDLGVRIAIDNFGTGYSSFSTLGTLAVDAIKIDNSIIINSLNKNKHLTIIKSIITLAQSIDLATVADGIETQEQLDTLIALHCDFAQGPLLAKPLTFDNYLKLLKCIDND